MSPCFARQSDGDGAVLPQLRRLLDERPALTELYGNLVAQAQRALVDLAAGSNLVYQLLNG